MTYEWSENGVKSVTAWSKAVRDAMLKGGAEFQRQKVCVFVTAGPITRLFALGGGKQWRTCATRDDEPRPVWTSLPITQEGIEPSCWQLE